MLKKNIIGLLASLSLCNCSQSQTRIQCPDLEVKGKHNNPGESRFAIRKVTRPAPAGQSQAGGSESQRGRFFIKRRSTSSSGSSSSISGSQNEPLIDFNGAVAVVPSSKVEIIGLTSKNLNTSQKIKKLKGLEALDPFLNPKILEKLNKL